MPPVSPQGSRAGLITAVVIFSILFVTGTIFAIYFHAEMRHTQEELDASRKKYSAILPEASLTRPEVTALADAKADVAAQQKLGLNPSMSSVDVALRQRDVLTRMIAGNEMPALAAYNVGNDSLLRAKETLQSSGVNLPSDGGNLAAAVESLATEIVARQKQVKTVEKQLEDARKQVQETLQNTAAELAKKQEEITNARADAAKSMEGATSDRAQKQQQVEQFTAQLQEVAKKSQEALGQKDVEIATLNRNASNLQGEIERLRSRLARTRPDPNQPAIRQADGTIIRLPGDGIAYINRGRGDQIVPGMTFEVYDKVSGIPALPADAMSNEDLPVGKASIEVVRVDPTGSQCRIIKQLPGSQLTEGDLIVNLVYDPYTKYTFMVYGDFDLDQNKIATAQDAEVIKRLVTQWGGALTSQVNVDTDFVVMGVEPKVPEFTQDELQDPVNKKKFDDATKALSDYQDVVQKASSLHIPVLNQNRFLYLVGYYDQMNR